MSNISGYPQKMPFEYINLLLGFTGGDRETTDYHMRNFWNFFLSYPVDDYAEDVVMKLFSTTLCCNAKEWYDNLPNASITTMEQFVWSNLKKSFSRDGVFSWKISQYYHSCMQMEEDLV
jgi:hypothetical protein